MIGFASSPAGPPAPEEDAVRAAARVVVEMPGHLFTRLAAAVPADVQADAALIREKARELMNATEGHDPNVREVIAAVDAMNAVADRLVAVLPGAPE